MPAKKPKPMFSGFRPVPADLMHFIESGNPKKLDLVQTRNGKTINPNAHGWCSMYATHVARKLFIGNEYRIGNA